MITDQLKNYCDCVEDITEDDVAELVHVISMATCWMREPCETFLVGDRREIIDLPSCVDCPITFEPYYKPFIGEEIIIEIDPDTGEPVEKVVPFGIANFKFYLVKVEGIEETVTEITDFRYHATDGMFHIIPGLPSCKCGCNPCGCPPSYKMVVEYKAGYSLIPDCLLPVFCNVLTVLKAKNNCDCSNDCGCENQEQQVKYASGDVVSVALETDIGKLLVEQYKNQLGMISLCRECCGLWGFVV